MFGLPDKTFDQFDSKGKLFCTIKYKRGGDIQPDFLIEQKRGWITHLDDERDKRLVASVTIEPSIPAALRKMVEELHNFFIERRKQGMIADREGST